METSRWSWGHIRAEGDSKGLNWAFLPAPPHRASPHTHAVEPVFPGCSYSVTTYCESQMGREEKAPPYLCTPYSRLTSPFRGEGRAWGAEEAVVFGYMCRLLYPRHVVRPATDGPGLALAVLNEVRATWSGFLSFLFFLSVQSLAFMTVVSMWICKRQIYDPKMINGLLFLAAVSLLAWLVCWSSRGA